MIRIRMSLCMAIALTMVVFPISRDDSWAQEADEATMNEPGFMITAGMQGGLGLSGQLALGGRLFILREWETFGSGLGLSFLFGERNIFVPSLVNVVKVSGATVFTEILFRVNLVPVTLQSALGMAIVRREGRTKRGIPVQFASQGIYVGIDARYPLNGNLSLLAGGRWAFLDHATLTLTGRREIVPLDTQPALFMGLAWDF